MRDILLAGYWRQDGWSECINDAHDIQRKLKVLRHAEKTNMWKKPVDTLALANLAFTEGINANDELTLHSGSILR